MKRQLLTGIGLTGIGMLLFASTVAFAQTTPAAPTVPGYPDTKIVPVAAAPAATPAAGTQASGVGLRQTLSNNLAKAGYTDVKIRPDAFIVEAKNKSGEPVMMFLTPDSMTVFTAQDAKGQDTTAAPATPPAK